MLAQLLDHLALVLVKRSRAVGMRQMAKAAVCTVATLTCGKVDAWTSTQLRVSDAAGV